MPSCTRWWQFTHSWGKWEKGCKRSYFQPGVDLPLESTRTLVRHCARCGLPQVKEITEAGWGSPEDSPPPKTDSKTLVSQPNNEKPKTKQASLDDAHTVEHHVTIALTEVIRKARADAYEECAKLAEVCAEESSDWLSKPHEDKENFYIVTGCKAEATRIANLIRSKMV